MKNRYIDLINQTFDFPQDEFAVSTDGELSFHDIPLMELVEQYGSPLKFTYLPKISENIQKARTLFNVAMAKADYNGKYHYCYCTKSNHFQYVLDEVLKNDIHKQTADEIQSSGYVLHTLEASIWCLLTTDNYKEAVLKAVNLGADTDTTGAVTGGLAGLLYGLDNIPTNWINQIARKDDIENLAERLAEKITIH